MRPPHLWSHPPTPPGCFPTYIHLTTKPLLSRAWIPSGYEGQWTCRGNIKHRLKLRRGTAETATEIYSKSSKTKIFLFFSSSSSSCSSAACPAPLNGDCHLSCWKLVVCVRVWQLRAGVCLLDELMCNNSYHFPLCHGRHAGVTVHQGLGGLWERVGDAVAETLAQTGSERRTESVIPTMCLTFSCKASVQPNKELWEAANLTQNHKAEICYC